MRLHLQATKREQAGILTSRSGTATFDAIMIRSELVRRIARKNPHLLSRDVERIVDVILDKIVDTLAEGGRVELRGFGTFSVKLRGERAGRNPRNGSQVEVRRKRIVSFRMGKQLHIHLNEVEETRAPSIKLRHGRAG